MFKRQFYILSFMIIFLPFRLFAWGHAGHAMVAELAMSMLSDATRVKVERVLNGMSAADAGNWMDQVKSDPQYKYMAPWHYVNIEPGSTYQPAASGDIISALNKSYTELQHPEKLTPEQVMFDVQVLFHLCGDLTQPLHVGYGSDKGGNTYQVQYNGKGTNMHSIWDSKIIETQGITLENLKEYSGLKLPPVNFMAWLDGSRALLSKVYVEGHKLDDAYMNKNRVVVIEQLRYGSYLLVSCLEDIFSKMSKVPVGSSITPPSTSQKPANAGKTLTPTSTITPDQAAAHIGETVTVCGKVYSTRALNNGPTFLNMGGDYPDNPFTAVIMFNKRGNFSYKPEEYLRGKTICVIGTIKNYNGKPEIVVNKEKQVEVQY